MNSNNQFYNPYPEMNNQENFNNARNRQQNPSNNQVSEQDFNNDNTQEAIARQALNNIERRATSWIDKCSCDLGY